MVLSNGKGPWPNMSCSWSKGRGAEHGASSGKGPCGWEESLQEKK
jgi:hypothetical protein